jgi:hypothetical protein
MQPKVFGNIFVATRFTTSHMEGKFKASKTTTLSLMIAK